MKCAVVRDFQSNGNGSLLPKKKVTYLDWVVDSSLEVSPMTSEVLFLEEEKEVETGDNKPSALLEALVIDDEYNNSHIELSDYDRELAERIVMGEAGNQGLEGAALVAQCIRDTMNYNGVSTVYDVIHNYGYDGATSKEPNQDVKDAVSYIFDEDGIAVQHKILFFYAPGLCNSGFHESQLNIVNYGGHKFFSTYN